MGIAVAGILLVSVITVVVMYAFGKNPHALARAGRAARLRDILRGTPGLLEARDGGGETPLMHAAKYGESEVVSLLLEKGANPNAECEGGGTALMLASGHGYEEVLDQLLRAGADPNACDEDGVTALHYAAHAGDRASIRVLMAAGADRSMTDAAGRTAAQVAVERGHARAGALLDAERSSGDGS